MNIDEELNLIERFLHYSTENFDDWFWDGKELRIYSDNNVEVYSYEDLKEILFIKKRKL